MIGQKHLQQIIEFNNFTILVGEKGSGKKTFVREHFNEHAVWVASIKVDDIRHMVSQSYKLYDTTFIIPDADDMSLAAKNAILKVVEECPNNNRYVMTLTDINNTLDTIKSRASVFNMDRYTTNDLWEYAREYGTKLDDYEWSIVKDICDVPGDVNTLGKNPLEFYEYVEIVIDNIAEVSGANAFKIADRIALKDEDDKYSLKLFWRAFLKKCVAEGTKSKSKDYIEAIKITATALSELRIKGINKQMLFDMWLLRIREVWL